MKKLLTIKIPNQLWVDDFTENKTAQFEYDGPDKIWVKSANSLIVPTWFDTEPEVDPTEATIIFPIDLKTASEIELAVAIILVNGSDPVEYTYQDETNYDGTIYKKITNPKLNEYYSIGLNNSSLSLNVNVKNKTIKNEEIALKRKNYVLKYNKVYDFDAADQTKIDEFLTTIDAYLETMETAYPWKFIELQDDIPKIPVSIVLLFNSLPDLS